MTIQINAHKDEIPICLTATKMGRDLCISLAGGDQAHIGAVALAQPRPSLEVAGTLSASTSVITVCGHKEDRLACTLAARIAAAIDARVSVSCGIHIAAATREQIDQACDIANRLVDELLAQLER
jgi:hypothetical protein